MFGVLSELKIKEQNVDAFMEFMDDLQDTTDMGVKVGVIGEDVSEEEARNSWALEHRYQGAGPSHWSKGQEYISWAFATRTKKYMEEKVLPNLVQSRINQEITGEQFWNQIGQATVNRMRSIMAGVEYPGNAPETIRQSPYKTTSNPLIASGKMKGKVKYDVRDADELEPASNNASEDVPAF